MPDKSVIVIGGGVCGLAAAHALTRAGVEVVLIEASARLGGQVRSEMLDDPGEFTRSKQAVDRPPYGRPGTARPGTARTGADDPSTGRPSTDQGGADYDEVAELGAGGRGPDSAPTTRADGASSRVVQPRVVELGAEAVPLRAPGVADLVEELGLTESMVHPHPGPSLLSSRRGAVPMPDGVTPTGPTRLLPTVRSQILSPRGLLRAAAEPVTGRRRVAGDVSVGEFIETRFGPQVARAVVDPLLGAIHAADIHRFSLAAAAPALIETSAEGNSLLLGTLAREAHRAAGWARALPVRGYYRVSRLIGLKEQDLDRPSPSPALASWPHGTATLAESLADSVRTHGTVLCGTRAVRLAAPASGDAGEPMPWRVGVEGPDGARELSADAVVLATGSAASAELLADVSPVAASILAGLRAVSVATVILDLPLEAALETHPISRAATWFVGSAWSPLIRQVTNLSLKWPQILGGDRLVLRVNVGRDGGRPLDGMDDEELAREVVAELRRLGLPVPTGSDDTSADATGIRIARFPQAMPQPAPGHRDRMESLAEAVSGVPGLELGGCAVDGAGVGTAIVAGRRLARQIRTFLDRESRDEDERGGTL